MLRPRARSTRRRRRGLGPNHHKLATAAAVSNLGDGVYLAALPLLAARLTRDPLRVSAVTAAGWLPWLLFGLVSGALVDRVFMAGQAILVLFAQEVLGLGGVGYGLLAAFAVGGLPGSLLVGMIGRRLRAGHLIVGCILLDAAATLLLGLAPTVWVVGAALAAKGFAVSVWGVTQVALRQVVVPDRLMGRVLGAARLVGMA